NGLRRRWPGMSAAPLRRRRRRIRARAAIATSLAVLGLAVAVAPLAVESSLALFFLAWLGLRFATALMPQPRALPPPVQSDGALPVYTVIAALYREARSLRALLRAIEQFDYPREKLDVLLAVEADDGETRAAHQAARAQCRAGFRARPLHRHIRRRRPSRAGPVAAGGRGLRGGRRRPYLRAGAAVDRQYRGRVSGADVHGGICRPIRRV